MGTELNPICASGRTSGTLGVWEGSGTFLRVCFDLVGPVFRWFGGFLRGVGIPGAFRIVVAGVNAIRSFCVPLFSPPKSLY